MEDFIFKVEAPRGITGNFNKDVNVEFWGHDYELAAVLVMLGQKHDFIKEAIFYAADHLKGRHKNDDLRDEPRVKEGQQENNLLNFIYEQRS